MGVQEGTISVDGYQVWYRRVGRGGIPLLLLHGGPGAGHDYLEPLEALATDRTVVFYDQLGCGRSDQPDDRSLWRLERFVAEIGTVRRALNLEQMHLLGQSWGGWLAIEYMLTHPPGVVSLVLASTSASIPQFVAEAERLKAALPPAIYHTLQRYEAAGEFHHPDYEAAVREFYQRHLCRLDPWPKPLRRSARNLTGNAVYETMAGPNEFIVTGNLQDWDRIDRLGEIPVPTLITVGRYDEITPTCAETMYRRIPHAQMQVFEQSSHTAHLEETERYLVRSKNSKSPFPQRLFPSTWKGWGQMADSGRHPLGVMAFSSRNGRVKPQRFQPLPVRSRVLERVINWKPLGRCRRQESIVCRHEHRF